MNHTQSLPEPSADALNHSKKLVDAIRQEIEASSSQSISFKRYMEMALYQPKLGYYVAGTYKIGEQGDFITAPEISPLFSRCVANQCAQVLQELDEEKENSNSILELGAGSGRMACDILLELERQDQLPERYFILDLSPDLIQRQQQTIKNDAHHLFHLVEWISILPEKFTGIILGNEVLDAMPVDVFTLHGDEVFEHHVIWQDETLIEQLKPANQTLKQKVIDLKISSDTPYTSEINSNINPWLKSLSECLTQGIILLIDYGYTRSEYYHSDRNKGTLICHYQHLVNEAALKYPGLQDITANVDFTAVAESADNSNLTVLGFTSQAHFLTNSGLEQYFTQVLEEHEPDDQKYQLRIAQQIRTLSLPSEMGERFKCIALGKEISTGKATSLIGFSDFDQRFRL